MPAVAIFLFLAIAVAATGAFGPNFELLMPAQIKLPTFLSLEKEGVSEDSKPKPEKNSGNIVIPKKPSQPEPTPPLKEETGPALINTYIISGPRTGAVINNTNKVTFKFGAEILSEEIEGDINYETKVEGLDEDWKRTSSQTRTIEFPLGPEEYTFLARAKIKNTDIVDPTPAKRKFEINISPYFGKVEISKLENPPPQEPFLLTLRPRLGRGDKTEINITNWEIEGEYGSFEILQGVEYLNPSVNDIIYNDILVKRGDTIYVSSAPNPLGAKDRNFKDNICMGYLTTSHNFPVTISKNCPRLRNEDLPWNLENCCKEYILSLGRCERPNYQGMEEYDLLGDFECRDYMNSKLTYAGCYRDHYQDNDFLENKWYIYINRLDKRFFDRNIDTLYLWDKDGLLVDEYSYGSRSCKECD